MLVEVFARAHRFIVQSTVLLLDAADAAAENEFRNLVIVPISGHESNIFDPFHLFPFGAARFVCASLIRAHRTGLPAG